MLERVAEVVLVRRAELGRQLAGFRQQWFGRMHRIDKFFHRVHPPPGAQMHTHRGHLLCLIPLPAP